jgi:catechol 2,3-dioxygenase-like lactoylglutathione lyase family enzyme
MDMLTNSEAFVTFGVPDVDEARDFYGDTLGLRTSDGDEGVLLLHIEGSRDVMLYPKPDHAPATYTVLNFPVEDVEQAVDALVERGVAFERYDDPGFGQDERGIARGGGPLIAWFRDPAGNILSVLQVP